ncbi:uncharacterized protein Dwil_GK15044 [Drosophila willistoni]|uniref:F-box domain-containing protein n=2 Tax=Drosophila willistoni TaxID=7260 RepID=B4MVK7_DROWI|nr:uncharacterized protein Dwil_GK15044 [Drosophila willistoni]
MQERIFKGRLVKYFQGNFINLKSLDISGAILTEENVFNIFSSTNKLENLILDHCCLTDESLLALKDLTNLKTLSIACNRSLSGHNLVMLPISIENLNLSFCIRIQPSHVIQMCKSLTNLLELNIVGVDPITNYGNFYNNMIEQNPCVSLQTLGLSTYDQCDGIAKLPNLKNIYIVIVEIPKEVSDTKFFDQLVIFKYEQLEELKIDEAFHITKQMLLQIAKLTGLKTLSLYKANNIDDDVIEAFTNLKKLENIILQNGNFSDSIIVRLVLGCPKLKEVNLVYCLQITRKLLDDIVVKIPIYYKKNERKLPILIFLSDNSYHRCPFMAPAQDIVKIFCYHT